MAERHLRTGKRTDRRRALGAEGRPRSSAINGRVDWGNRIDTSRQARRGVVNSTRGPARADRTHTLSDIIARTCGVGGVGLGHRARSPRLTLAARQDAGGRAGRGAGAGPGWHYPASCYCGSVDSDAAFPSLFVSKRVVCLEPYTGQSFTCTRAASLLKISSRLRDPP